MLMVPRTLIDDAKEKLGDRNWEIICDCYGIANDTTLRQRKACCPKHVEHTASFCYNDKKYYAHCFGCGCTVDVITALEESGLTYIDAVKKIFEEAGISYNFSEQHVKTEKKNYIYPTLPPQDNDRTKVEQYWSVRRVSKKALDFCDVRADEYGNSVFITYNPQDVATDVKYKPTELHRAPGSPKMWHQKGTSSSENLFNMNRVTPTMPLVIAEGEPDVLSFVTAGYTNVVSPLSGATSYEWIKTNLEFLDQWTKIIVCGDHDEPGRKMNDNIRDRLGSWRVCVADIPDIYVDTSGNKHHIKDANEYLYWAGPEALLSAVTNPKESEIPSVVNFSDIAELDMSQMPGIETGFKEVDKVLTKLFFGTLTLLAGRSGAGKSSFTNALIANSIEQGYPVFLFSGEMLPEYTKSWLMAQLAGPRHMCAHTGKNGDVYYTVNDDVKYDINSYMNNQLFLYREDFPRDEDSILTSMEDNVRKYGVKLLILDNLMTINLKNTSDDKLESQKQFISRLIAFAAKWQVAVLLCCHLRKRMSGEAPTTDIDLDSIAGSSDITNLAHRTIGLRRVSKQEKQDIESPYNNYDVVINIAKDRMGGHIDQDIPMHYDVSSRRFYSDYAEYDHKYPWDKTVYRKQLPLPQCLERQQAGYEDAVFGKEKDTA